MTLGAALHGFLIDYLPQQRAFSPHTLYSYRDSLKLLLHFAAGKGRDPSGLTIEDLTVQKVTAFLHSVEVQRHNCASTRNVRLSAIHSFFRYLGREQPEYLGLTQRILSVPFKRTRTRQIEDLDFDEIQGVLKAIPSDQEHGCGTRHS